MPAPAGPLVDIVRWRAHEHGTKLAIVSPSATLSYAELWTAVGRCARWLEAQSVSTGSRVLWRCDPGDVWFAVGYLATHWLGAIAAPVDGKAPAAAIEAIQAELEPELAVTNEVYAQFREIVAAGDAPSDADREVPHLDAVADVLFTGGTTGRAKGVVLTHANIMAAASNINTFIGNGFDDREVVTVPLNHSFGLGRLRCNLTVGGTVILVPGLMFPSLAFESLAKQRATGLACVPTGAALLVKWGSDRLAGMAGQLRYIELGSAPMPLETKRTLMGLLPQTRICMHYGLTEASRSCFLEFHADARHLESIGRPAPDVTIRIRADDGSAAPAGVTGPIEIKGAAVMKGYWRDPDRTARVFQRDGWLDTGDLGCMNDEGYIYLVGRNDDVINVGGKKIYPAAVEQAACQFPGILECACVSAPGGVAGEVPVIYIVSSRATPLDAEGFIDFLKTKIEAHAVPRSVYVLRSLPKTSAGKVMRRALRDRSRAAPG